MVVVDWGLQAEICYNSCCFIFKLFKSKRKFLFNFNLKVMVKSLNVICLEVATRQAIMFLPVCVFVHLSNCLVISITKLVSVVSSADACSN